MDPDTWDFSLCLILTVMINSDCVSALMHLNWHYYLCCVSIMYDNLHSVISVLQNYQGGCHMDNKLTRMTCLICYKPPLPIPLSEVSLHSQRSVGKTNLLFICRVSLHVKKFSKSLGMSMNGYRSLLLAAYHCELAWRENIQLFPLNVT